MILTKTQIKDILLNNPNKALISSAKVNNKKLRMHMYGEGLSTEICQIEGFEKEEMKKLRAKYAKSNKDLFSRLGRPIDKVFSARGGSVYYNLTDPINKQAMLLANSIRDGFSIKKWVENYWKPHYLDDPNGIIFIEIGAPINNKPTVYPTYKPITEIYDYLPKGSSLEYIVFNVCESDKLKAGLKSIDKVFRVVDDAFDYYVKIEGETIVFLDNNTYPNYFYKVPAILNSDIVNPEVTGGMLSLYNDVIELADDFLMTGSIRNLMKLRHGYPKYWEYADDCPVCKGEKVNKGKDCETCKGTGKKLMINPGDAKLLMWPDGKDIPMVAPNVAGYVEPSQTYFDLSTNELIELENAMSLTLWGAETKRQTQGMSANNSGGTVKTATEIIDDIQPKADRLQLISESAEKRHKFILDLLIQLNFSQNYSGSSVNYGRRYMIEGPDTIWLRYSDARVKGAAVSILDDLLMEYIETKYNGDPVSMAVQLKLLAVEPFVHLTISQVQALKPSEEDYNKKLYFSEWLATLNEAMLYSFSTEELKKQLSDYVAAKKIITEPEKELTQ